MNANYTTELPDKVSADQIEYTFRELSSAIKAIAPLWPLENFVAVNPYLGLIDKPFREAAKELYQVANIQSTLPVSFYLEKIQSKDILPEDLSLALSKSGYATWESVAHFLHDLPESPADKVSECVTTVADIASNSTGKDWNRFILNRITAWAGSYFDKGQSTWNSTTTSSNLFSSWKNEAGIDRSPEITGLSNFRKRIKALPENSLEAAALCLRALDVPQPMVHYYLERLLFKVKGWAGVAAHQDWQNNLQNTKSSHLIDFLAILLAWEYGLLEGLDESMVELRWINANKNNPAEFSDISENSVLAKKLILQEAFDLGAQRKLREKFSTQKRLISNEEDRAKAQAIFCIDVRSEVYRRNLEGVDDQIETLGFAGFFGFPIEHFTPGSVKGTAQCPVLLAPSIKVADHIPDEELNKQVATRNQNAYSLAKVWKSFRSGAISCFSFVSPLGLYYLPKLLTDSFGLSRPVANPVKRKGRLTKLSRVKVEPSEMNGKLFGLTVNEQVDLARNALTAMSLTDNFAKLVLITGHGSTSVNNPHATGLDCGACGGNSGAANAQVAAAVFNNRAVQLQLKEMGIDIPQDTLFLACLHDTTTDEVTILNKSEITAQNRNEVKELEQLLKLAGQRTRIERAHRFYSKGFEKAGSKVKGRANDWSQIRPEWGLSGCSAFVVAPRNRTIDIDLEGKSFLHSYDYKKDKGFAVLESIMTAPMVVTNWINMQYFASTVDNKEFGSGNKALHNVTSGLGVLEGYSGDLRVGLPMQSIHDGEKYQHEPLRLTVLIEAPKEAVEKVLQKHEVVRNLVDNNWIFLMLLDEQGKVSCKYSGDLSWENY